MDIKRQISTSNRTKRKLLRKQSQETDSDGRIRNNLRINESEQLLYSGGAVDVDENQSFIFHISGDVSENEYLPMAKAVDMDVIVYGNGNTTVKSLPAGTYRVTEMNKDNNGWSWRYTANDKNQQMITPTPGSNDNVLTFANTRDNSKWLNGSNFAKNLFNANIENNGFKIFGECVGVWNHSCSNRKSSN